MIETYQQLMVVYCLDKLILSVTKTIKQDSKQIKIVNYNMFRRESIGSFTNITQF